MKLSGGSYDSAKCVIGKGIFQEADRLFKIYKPYKNHKKHEKAIYTGLWLSDRRIEMGE